MKAKFPELQFANVIHPSAVIADDIRFGQFPEPNQRIELPSYTTLDLSGGITVLPGRRSRPSLELTARVENVFDEQYEQAVGFPARGRGVFVGVTTDVR